MNTPGHAIVNLATQSRPREPERNAPVAVGAILPDVPIFIFWVWATLTNQPDIWSEAYFAPGWQAFIDLFHSVPLTLLLLLGAWYADWEWGRLLAVSMLLHIAFDFFLHAEDAHRHFFPVSDFRFHSPVSYWNPEYYGNIVAPIEMAVALGLSVLVWRRLETRWGKALLLAGDALYLIGFIGFSLFW